MSSHSDALPAGPASIAGSLVGHVGAYTSLRGERRAERAEQEQPSDRQRHAAGSGDSAKASAQHHDRRNPANQRRAREQPQPAELPVGRLAAKLEPHRFLGATALLVELLAFELQTGVIAIERLLQRGDDHVGQRASSCPAMAWTGGGSGFAMRCWRAAPP